MVRTYGPHLRLLSICYLLSRAVKCSATSKKALVVVLRYITNSPPMERSLHEIPVTNMLTGTLELLAVGSRVLAPSSLLQLSVEYLCEQS